jgi:hypothetical protein
MKRPMPPNRSIRLYAALQVAALIGCWSWFLVLLGISAIQNYTMAQSEWWVLLAAACAGLFGLRPNLEKAIDRTWVGDLTNTAAAAERAAMLKPVKRRIDIIFSLFLLVLVIATVLLWYVTGVGTTGAGTGWYGTGGIRYV